ncbi:MAG: phage holin family protein [Bacteroidales bacterium]|nr:phage holin family protein [Bacteroidales bacterium]MBR5027743.1 phage holin family protein [Bacteroidales bacterium]
MQVHITNQNNNESNNYGCLAQTIIMTLSLMVVGLLLPGVHINNVLTAIVAALVIALLNNFLRPILLVLSLPFTIVTMGLFILVINAIIIWLAGKILEPSFALDSFGTAFLAALIITLINYILELPNRLRNRKNYESNHHDNDDDDPDFDEFIEYEEVLDKDDE